MPMFCGPWEITMACLKLNLVAHDFAYHGHILQAHEMNTRR